jgi:hypothetical protein
MQGRVEEGDQQGRAEGGEKPGGHEHLISEHEHHRPHQACQQGHQDREEGLAGEQAQHIGGKHSRYLNIKYMRIKDPTRPTSRDIRIEERVWQERRPNI